MADRKKKKRRSTRQKRGGISTTHILIVAGAAVLVVGLLVVLNTNRSRTAVSDLAYEMGITPEGEPYKGSPDAPLQLVEYSDFLCGHCGSLADAIETLKELCDYPFDFVEVSPETGEGMPALMHKIFDLLEIIRVYSKPPGKPADMTEPFTLPIGSTVMDLAKEVHRQLAEKLKTARIWGTGVHDGQNTQKTHVLNDKDIVELHFS